MERDIQSKNIEVLDENLKNIVISRMRRHYYYSPVFFFSPFSQCRSWMESSFYLGLLWPLLFFVFLIFTSKQNEGNKNKSCLHEPRAMMHRKFTLPRQLFISKHIYKNITWAWLEFLLSKFSIFLTPELRHKN